MNPEKDKKELKPVRKHPTFDEIFPDKAYLLIILMGIITLIVSMYLIAITFGKFFRYTPADPTSSSGDIVSPYPDDFISSEPEISGSPEDFIYLSPEPSYKVNPGQ